MGPASVHARSPFWRDERKISIVAQAIFLVAVVAAIWSANAALQRSFVRQNIRLNWGFLRQPAGFELSALTWTIDLKTWRIKQFTPTDSYAEALIAGIFNTIKVAALGITLATMLGILVGVSRLSSNWLINRLALAYVEFLRNTPLLVQLFFWYFAVFLQLPNGSREQPPLQLFGSFVVITNAGLAIGGTVVERFGRLVVDGGYQLTGEFAALVLGLAIYTSSFIAEIVRGGILAVQRGQMEAARSLGLTYRQALQYIVLPQALRIVLLPLGNQFLNLTKNSSLAIGIGYAELLTTGNLISSQSFRSFEAFTFVTLSYLVLSLSISGLLNLIRHRTRLPATQS